MVVTSGPLPVSIDSATSHVAILDRGQLDMAPPAGLGDTLANLPGLRSTAFGPGSSRPVIRGLSGPRVLILQNGVGMIDAEPLAQDRDHLFHQGDGAPGLARLAILLGQVAHRADRLDAVPPVLRLT